MLSKRYESTEVDRKTWLHVPSGTHLFLRDPIGNKPLGFYGLSRLTMSYLFDNKFFI